MKPTYEKPVIIRLETGMMNKFGSSPLHTRRVRETIEDIPVEDLVNRFGSPLFVYSEKKLRKKYRDVYRQFSTRYPNVTFGWSYKTNFLKAICAIMHQEGSIAEVVSDFEYDKALTLGIPGPDIIFNGPYKPIPALEKAASAGSMIHIDHLDEISDLEKVADKLGKKIKVGIRLNMDTGIQPQWSRFGLNLESGQAMDAVRRIAVGGKLELNGLHCHIGTFILEPDAYAREVEKMVSFAYAVEDSMGFKITYLDVGGGLPSRSKLKGTYLPPDLGVPPVDEYAEKISDALYQSLRPGDFPRLIMEMGRALVDESACLITTVWASKRLPDGRRSYILDAGLNTLFTSFWYKFNVEIDRPVQGMNEPSVLYGPLCMNIDVVDEGSLLPPLERGTRLIVSPVGAYNNTQWMQFIQYRPPVVMVREQGDVEIIRESEDLTDMERRERLPKGLEPIRERAGH
jgi:diaminopimelate decarboxylase